MSAEEVTKARETYEKFKRITTFVPSDSSHTLLSLTNSLIRLSCLLCMTSWVVSDRFTNSSSLFNKVDEFV